MARVKVLMVCMGNICRSPMAEAVFRHKVALAGLTDQITIDSAGTHRYHIGERAHPGTLSVLKHHGIDYDGRARHFKAADFEQFDYVLAMDRENYDDIRMVGDGDNLHMFLSFANAAGLTSMREVPDPYYDGRFEEVYTLVNQGADALLAHIRKTHNL